MNLREGLNHNMFGCSLIKNITEHKQPFWPLMKWNSSIRGHNSETSFVRTELSLNTNESQNFGARKRLTEWLKSQQSNSLYSCPQKYETFAGLHATYQRSTKSGVHVLRIQQLLSFGTALFSVQEFECHETDGKNEEIRIKVDEELTVGKSGFNYACRLK